MKKLFFTLLASVLFISIYGQAPQEINYQGVARNSSGTLLSNQNIGIKLDLHQGSAGGTIVFSEAHNKTTNIFGLFTLGIGSVNASGFIAINWANGPYFLEVSMDPAGGTSYSSVGTQQFMSVPYALYAQTAGNASATPTITINAPNTVTSSAGSYTINVPAAISYSAGTGIDITGGVISNTASATTPTIIGTGATTVTGTYPNLTINTPTVAPDQTVSLVGTGNATVTGSYPNFTVNVPSGSNLPTGLNGQFLYHTGTIWDTLPRANLYFDGTNIGIGTTSPQSTFHVVGAGRFNASVTTNQIYANNINLAVGTFTNAGDVLTNDGAGNGTWQALPTPTLSYNNGTNVLSLSQGTTVTTATLNGTGSNTVSIVGAGIASVTPTTGSTFTVTVPNPTLSIASGSLSISNGNSVAIPSPSLSINSNSLTINGPGGNTVALNTYTAGTGISITGSAPNYVINNTAPAAVTQTLIGTGISSVTTGANTFTVNTPMPIYTQTTGILSFGGTNTVVATPSLSILGNVLRSGPATNTVNLPAAVITGTGTGIATVTTSVNNFTVNVPAPTYTASNGVLGFGTNTLDIAPTLSLTGTTLTSGAATNSVSLAGLNGIYGGSGSIQTGSTTVTVGTNTLTFLSGNTANKPIANFFGGGFTGTSMTLGHVGTNSANFKFIGSATTTPVDYGYVSGSTNGISISGGTSSNGLYVTNTAEVGVGTFTTGTGKFVITHTASQANPTMHLRETSGGLNRIKFSNNTVANKFFETAAQTNAVDANGAYSINYFDGITYKPVLLVTGERKVNINNLNTVLASLHVMENSTTAGGGIASEGFAQSGQLNLIRNNQPVLAARTAVISGDELGKINFAGYDGAAFGDGAKIYAKAAENVTGSNKGTELVFAAVPTGTNTNKEVFKINGANKLEVITSLLIPFNAAAGNVLTSDALGNASWQTITAPASPWIQGAGIVTQGTINDKVGIGTGAPQSLLEVATDGSLVNGLRVSNSSSTANGPSIFLDGQNQDWTITGSNAGNGSGANKFVIRDYSNFTDRFVIDNTGKVGVGLTSPESMFHVQNAAGSQIKMGNINQPTLEWYWDVDGTSNMFLRNEGNGTTQTLMYFDFNSGHLGLGAGAPGYKFTVIGTASDDVASIYAVNNATTTSTASHGIYGLTLNTHSLSAGVYGNNNSVGPSVYAEKNATQTGIAGRFEIKNTANNADVVFTKTDGGGAAIHAVNGPTVTGGSNVALWIEAGHIKTSGTTPAITTTLTTLQTYTVIGNDVAGKLSALTSTLTAVPAGQDVLQITFSKPYPAGSAPVIILTNTSPNSFAVQAYVTGVTNTGFKVRFNNASALNTSYSFNYLVIE